MTEPNWMRIARSYTGLSETPGAKHNPQIIKFFAEAGFSGVKDDETAWCAAFVNAVLKQAGIKGSGSLAARSFLRWGRTITRPEPGCIVVFRRGSSSWQGHVGFFVKATETHIHVLGGNQSNRVNVAAYPKASLLGYRMPELAAQFSPVPPPDIAPIPARPKPSRRNAAVATAGTVAAGGAAVAAAEAGMPVSLIVGALVVGLVIGVGVLIWKKRK